VASDPGNMILDPSKRGHMAGNDTCEAPIQVSIHRSISPLANLQGHNQAQTPHPKRSIIFIESSFIFIP
jgi:hypothetical protein